MTDLRKAAEMALEALETFKLAQNPIVPQSIYVLRQALAQPEQEPQRPVKSYTNNSPQYATDDRYTKPENVDTSAERVHGIDKSIHDDDDIQEYKKPWVSLTDEEIEVIAKRLMDDKTYCSLHFAVAIEAALRSKNT